MTMQRITVLEQLADGSLVVHVGQQTKREMSEGRMALLEHRRKQLKGIDMPRWWRPAAWPRKEARR